MAITVITKNSKDVFSDAAYVAVHNEGHLTISRWHEGAQEAVAGYAPGSWASWSRDDFLARVTTKASVASVSPGRIR